MTLLISPWQFRPHLDRFWKNPHQEKMRRKIPGSDFSPTQVCSASIIMTASSADASMKYPPLRFTKRHFSPSPKFSLETMRSVTICPMLSIFFRLRFDRVSFAVPFWL